MRELRGTYASDRGKRTAKGAPGRVPGGTTAVMGLFVTGWRKTSVSPGFAFGGHTNFTDVAD